MVWSGKIWALPESQERISSAIELSQESDSLFKGSPELVACLTRQAETDADQLDPGHLDDVSVVIPPGPSYKAPAVSTPRADRRFFCLQNP